jgi:hypothetical protein
MPEKRTRQRREARIHPTDPRYSPSPRTQCADDRPAKGSTQSRSDYGPLTAPPKGSPETTAYPANTRAKADRAEAPRKTDSSAYCTSKSSPRGG